MCSLGIGMFQFGKDLVCILSVVIYMEKRMKNAIIYL